MSTLETAAGLAAATATSEVIRKGGVVHDESPLGSSRSSLRTAPHLYLPKGQEMHEVAAVAAEAYLPASHVVHEAEPGELLYVPAGQTAQVPELMYFPAGQTVWRVRPVARLPYMLIFS